MKDIPLQDASGKEYSKVPLDNYEVDESTLDGDDVPLQNGAVVAHVSINDGTIEDDKETLLVEEDTTSTSSGLPWRMLISIYFIVWTESAVMNGFNPIIPGIYLLF